MRGTLSTCRETFTHRGGQITTEQLWLYLPNDGERRFLGLVSEMTEEQAIAMIAAIENDSPKVVREMPLDGRFDDGGAV